MSGLFGKLKPIVSEARDCLERPRDMTLHRGCLPALWLAALGTLHFHYIHPFPSSPSSAAKKEGRAGLAIFYIFGRMSDPKEDLMSTLYVSQDPPLFSKSPN